MGPHKCATGTNTSFAAVPQDGDKPVFVPVEPAYHSRACCLGSADLRPVFLRPARSVPQLLREFLQHLLEALDRVGLFLVFRVNLLLLQRILRRLLRHRIALALSVHTTHDRSPSGSSSSA